MIVDQLRCLLKQADKPKSKDKYTFEDYEAYRDTILNPVKSSKIKYVIKGMLESKETVIESRVDETFRIIGNDTVRTILKDIEQDLELEFIKLQELQRINENIE